MGSDPLDMTEREFDEKMLNGILERHPELARYPIHRWRWRALTLWILIFTLAVGYVIRHERSSNDQIAAIVKANREQIQDLSASKAQLSALQRTNCGLKKFLLTARLARYEAYLHGDSANDLKAVIGYENLVTPFAASGATGDCKIPKRLQIPNRPLPRG